MTARPEIPPRPEGGYPDSFFQSWGSTPETFVPWWEAYMATYPGDLHGDLMRWMLRHEAAEVYVDGTKTRQISVRLPEDLIAQAEAEGSGSPAGRSGVIRTALTEHFERRAS